VTTYQAILARCWPPSPEEAEEIGAPQETFAAAYELARGRVSHLSRAFFGVRLPSGECFELPTADHEAAQDESAEQAYSPARVVWG
jgi:hypothetical protein